ncbi:ewing's tumor-associated antigen 1 homolog [Suncus etruscus]|uniref:ewing's tumor-associated antigen 1 homolog n=1 Tax=Suncus etruscus TaxID=109475 RepID=UPI0021109DEA|nr:ewing's tumor-associated antigen 1 homolog [Suncus etruscus]
MSRRRKHGESPTLKKTPRKATAAEECGLKVESGKRRLKSAHGGAAERPPRPGVQREPPAAASSCSKSHPEEKYETPERILKMDLSSTFSSPNDLEGQNDIFWDQNSPMTKQLGKGRKKQIYTTDSDVISHIVNRIAPQDEKPPTNSLLGIWIGETAIPCTPNEAKGKSRGKINCIKLKTQNREEELMKLAKQFDKNMEELDGIQEQNKINHVFIHKSSEAEILNNFKENVQMHLLPGIIPEIDNSIIKKKSIKENSKISVENDQIINQKPFDLSAEAAFNAIFDGSTQKCSGVLSQDSSYALLNTSNTVIAKKSPLKEENVITNETLVTEKLQSKTHRSLSHQEDAPLMSKSCVSACTKAARTSRRPIDTLTTSDFEDDWEKLLSNEPYIMQNIRSSELCLADQNEPYTFNIQNDESNSKTNTNLDVRLKDSKNSQDLCSKTRNSELIDASKYRVLPNPSGKVLNKLPSSENKMKFDKSLNTVVEDKYQDCTVRAYPTKIKEDIHSKFTSTINTSSKMSSNTWYSNEQKNKSNLNQSLKTLASIEPCNSSILDSKASVCNSNQTNASKLGLLFDDWSDPVLSNEIIKACHQLENTWEVDDVDDDLLYQACDDIEKLSQDKEDGKTSENILNIHNSSKHGSKNMFTPSVQGSSLLQSKHLNLCSISGQKTSLTNSPQINKSVKMEKREIYGNSPGFIGATTNLSIYSKSTNCQENNLHFSRNNSDVPIQVNNSKPVLVATSSEHHQTIEIAPEKNLNTQCMSHRNITDKTLRDLNRTVRSSKYTFTRMKNPQVHSQFNQNYLSQSGSDTKIPHDLENKTLNPFYKETFQQQTSVKLSASLKQPSKEEEKNRKCSPEEIQRKRQEAMVRRMARAQATTVKAAPS